MPVYAIMYCNKAITSARFSSIKAHKLIYQHGSTLGLRKNSTQGFNRVDIESLLSKPSWSVKSLHDNQQSDKPTETISQGQLHHLLRLSALPLPKSRDEETEMIRTLESQLHFVQAIQSVNTTGVEPLVSIRDETEQARAENEITVESLQDELDQEEVVGMARRIRRKPSTIVRNAEACDVLGQAPKKVGRYVVVKTKKS